MIRMVLLPNVLFFFLCQKLVSLGLSVRPGVWKRNRVTMTFPANPCEISSWAVDLDILPAPYGSHKHTMQICLPQVVSHRISAPFWIVWMDKCTLSTSAHYILCCMHKLFREQVEFKSSIANVDVPPVPCTHRASENVTNSAGLSNGSFTKRSHWPQEVMTNLRSE